MRKETDQLTRRILILILIFTIQFSHLQAQDVITDSLITVRLQSIKNTLEHDQVQIKRWWYGWLAAYSAATIGQGAVYLTSNDKSTRQDMVLGAATTFLGAAGQFITPLIPGNEPEQFSLIPATTRSEQLNKLAKGEAMFNECAKREKLAMNWKNHALTGAVNLGGGLITWLGFKRTLWDGIGYFALNSVITETQIWTQPTLAKRNYRKYRQKFPESEDGISYQPEINWYLEAYPNGIGIKVEF